LIASVSKNISLIISVLNNTTVATVKT